jgi:hypothetical protein
MGSAVVEEVAGGKARTRFVELPQALHGEDPRFAPLVLTWERYRIDAHRNPYLDRAEAVLLLVRRAGRPVGRIAAHVPEEGATEGRFGFWCTVEDRRVADALLGAAGTWLAERGCTSMVGPWSFEPDDEPGHLASGFDAPGTTGRPWRPEWEAGLLEASGGQPVTAASTWRLPAEDLGVEPEPGGPTPGQAGPHADPRLVLDAIAAVPDLSDHLRSSGLRGAWSLARRVREGDWDGCTVVRCAGEPARLVPVLLTAAARAGYAWVVAPWSPDPGAPPETTHRTYRFDL